MTEMPEQIKNLLRPGEEMPAGFEEMYRSVKRRTDCVAPCVTLAPQIIALMIEILLRSEDSDEDTVEELVEEQESDFPNGTEVCVCRDGEFVDGVVIASQRGRLHVKLENDNAKFRVVDKNSVSKKE